MNTIEERLADVFGQLDVPDHDLVSGVLSEISTSAPAPTPARTDARWPSPLLVAAALAAVVCVASLVIQPTREALASWLGIGATRVEFVDPSTADHGAVGSETQETEPSPSAEATVQTPDAGSDPAVRNPIPALGAPAAIDPTEVGRGRRFSWTGTADLPALPGSTAGLILSVRSVDGPLDLKRLSSDESLQMVTLDLDGGSAVGMWIASDHQYLAAADDRPTNAEQVLIWVVDDVQYRLEAELPRARMIELAEQTTHGTDLLQPG